MAFLRTANAIVVEPRISQQGWSKVRTAGRVNANPSKNLVAQASEILGQPFNPDKYLLTHCTIVASVNVESIKGVKVGSVTENGRRINRRYADFRVTTETDQYINNNFDCFSRDVLLKSYRTFIGSHNFQEHVQVEDLSKGRIIDAVARDIGDSIYVDILVATDRKHAGLVQDIESGKLGTLSMGCSVEETICTKCGNVAPDETELCECIKYHKGNVFLDENGKKHRIAELCGHSTMAPTGGVTFIEASWVASPAFTGAVMRNILTPTTMSEQLRRQAQYILSSPPAQWTTGEGRQKAARSGVVAPTPKVAPTYQGGVVTTKSRKAEFDFGPAPEEGGGEAAEPKPPGMFDQLEDDITKDVMNRVRDRIRSDMSKKDEAAKSKVPDSTWQNTSLQKTASLVRHAYAVASSTIIRNASSSTEVMDRIATLDREFGFSVSPTLYRTALTVGAINKFGTDEKYLSVCRDTLRRTLTQNEAGTLLRLGRILHHAETFLRSPHPKGTPAGVVT